MKLQTSASSLTEYSIPATQLSDKVVLEASRHISLPLYNTDFTFNLILKYVTYTTYHITINTISGAKTITVS